MTEQDNNPTGLITQNEIIMARFERHFCAAHRIPSHQGHCRRIHGHNYHVTVDVSADALTDSGFVVEWATVKNLIDAMDHKLVLYSGDDISITGSDVKPEEWFYLVGAEPSTEYLARHLAERIGHATKQENARAEYVYVTVNLQETPSIAATASWSYDKITEDMQRVAAGLAEDGSGSSQAGQSSRAHLSSLR